MNSTPLTHDFMELILCMSLRITLDSLSLSFDDQFMLFKLFFQHISLDCHFLLLVAVVLWNADHVYFEKFDSKDECLLDLGEHVGDLKTSDFVFLDNHPAIPIYEPLIEH